MSYPSCYAKTKKLKNGPKTHENKTSSNTPCHHVFCPTPHILPRRSPTKLDHPSCNPSIATWLGRQSLAPRIRPTSTSFLTPPKQIMTRMRRFGPWTLKFEASRPLSRFVPDCPGSPRFIFNDHPHG